MAWFGSDRTLGNQHQHVYTSSLPEHPNEKEFTIPLVALAATCVCIFTPYFELIPNSAPGPRRALQLEDWLFPRKSSAIPG